MNTDPIDHDQLFKQLLSTFFVEFLDLFLPAIAPSIDRTSIHFLPQEYFTDIPTGEKKVIDLLAQVQLAGQEIGFLVHVEAQSSSQADFSRRMFFYFAQLHQRYLQRIYPIVVFSFDEPHRAETDGYTVEFEDLQVLTFNFRAIQLNRLNWRDYLSQPNPVAAALMAKMRIAPGERPKVKAECLRLLATLRLDPARSSLISGFVDTYLRLNGPEEAVFQAEVGKMEATVQEGVMQIVTSWMEQGIEQGIERGIERGIEQGIEQGERSLTLRLLTRRIGPVPDGVRSRLDVLPVPQLEQLAEALLDFTSLADLEAWLGQQ
jgi:Domain of unknown function (DUF4351)/Putative transposase, YhgA-like